MELPCAYRDSCCPADEARGGPFWEHANTLAWRLQQSTHAQEATAVAGPTFNGQLFPIDLLLAEDSSHNGIGPSAGLAGAIDLQNLICQTRVQSCEKSLGRYGQVLVQFLILLYKLHKHRQSAPMSLHAAKHALRLSVQQQCHNVRLIQSMHCSARHEDSRNCCHELRG